MTHLILMGTLTILITLLLTLTGWRYGNRIGMHLRSLNQEARNLNSLTRICREKELIRIEHERITRQDQIARGLRRRASYKKVKKDRRYA